MRLFRIFGVALSLASVFIVPMTVSAFKVTVDGVIYNCNKDNKRASVQGCQDKAELKKLTIPDNILHSSGTYTVTSIARNAFEGCTELTKVTMGNGIETIGSYAFSESGVKTITLSGGLKIIGEGAFYFCDLTSVTLPESLEIIRKGAFRSCHYLKTVTFGRKLKEIGDHAFWWCDKLTAANLPNSLTSLGVEAFMDCESLKSVTLSSGLTSIPTSAFENCPIENIVIPASVTSIGYSAFINNHTPVINIPGTVKTIGEWAFALGTGHTLTLGEGVTNIGVSAFEECVNVKSLALPRSAVNVGKRAFARCYAMASVSLAPTLAVLPEQMFFESGLTSLTVPEGVTTIGVETFGRNYHMKSVVFPKSLRTISDKGLDDCDGLETITMQEGLETIGANAFGGYYVKSLTIPASVKKIGAQAFDSMVSLRDVKALGATPAECGTDAFSTGAYDWGYLEVPAGSEELYRTAPEWERFTEISTPGSTGIDGIRESESSEIRYYTIDGLPADTPLPGRLYIRETIRHGEVVRREKTRL